MITSPSGTPWFKMTKEEKELVLKYYKEALAKYAPDKDPVIHESGLNGDFISPSWYWEDTLNFIDIIDDITNKKFDISMYNDSNTKTNYIRIRIK